MAVTIYKIKKWFNMMIGNSVHHVNQDEGRCYSKDEIKGYYNNLTEKVTRFGAEGNEVPITPVDTGEVIYFSIAIFQYGLASYDLYLMNSDKSMLEKTIACANWAVENQHANGGWITFSYENEEHPYSSMAQGEGISLLLRVYKEMHDERYLDAAKKAVEFMLLPIEEGGTAYYNGKDVYLYECTYEPLILNGWIFSLWGLFDYIKMVEDDVIKDVYRRTVATIIKTLPEYELGYWSRYELGKRISSPFYHKLHVAQLTVLYKITGEDIFNKYAQRWSRFEKSFLKRNYAFLKKAMQKVME